MLNSGNAWHALITNNLFTLVKLQYSKGINQIDAKNNVHEVMRRVKDEKNIYYTTVHSTNDNFFKFLIVEYFR